MQGASAGLAPGLPSMGQWIAPTLNPDELAKRIQELKTVQFWLDSNAKLLATTIQALEVQRMTLSTLQQMNMPLADLRDALKIGLPSAAAAPAPTPVAAPAPRACSDAGRRSKRSKRISQLASKRASNRTRGRTRCSGGAR